MSGGVRVFSQVTRLTPTGDVTSWEDGPFDPEDNGCDVAMFAEWWPDAIYYEVGA